MIITQDMTIRKEQILVAVQVVIQWGRSEAQCFIADGRVPGTPTEMLEQQIARVSVQRVLMLITVSQEHVDLAVAVEVRTGNSHTGFIHAIFAAST
ncbi:MAG: hypothetical protein RIK87_23860 [Fuerstiella sp.]